MHYSGPYIKSQSHNPKRKRFESSMKKLFSSKYRNFKTRSKGRSGRLSDSELIDNGNRLQRNKRGDQRKQKKKVHKQ